MNGEMRERGRSGRGRSGERRGESWERMGGIDRVLDRALQMTRELYRLLQSAEAGVDDVARDLQKAGDVHREAERVERRAEGLERKEEAIEREALRDITGGRERERGRSGRGRSGRGRSGRRGDWRGR